MLASGDGSQSKLSGRASSGAAVAVPEGPSTCSIELPPCGQNVSHIKSENFLLLCIPEGWQSG